MNWLVSRLVEPSTHAGLAAGIQVAKLFFPEYIPVIDGFTAAFASLAVVLKEKKIIQ